MFREGVEGGQNQKPLNTYGLKWYYCRNFSYKYNWTK